MNDKEFQDAVGKHLLREVTSRYANRKRLKTHNPDPLADLTKYLARSCPKCNGYLGIVVPERKAKMPVQAINGRCLKCGYRLAWGYGEKRRRS